MSERMITFNDLSDDMYRLDGMMAEVPYVGKDIFVGKVIGTLWWPVGHIRQLQLAEGRLWNPKTRKWTREDGYVHDFGPNMLEYFFGPYETETGDIFFLQDLGENAFFYVRFFEKNGFEDSGVYMRPLGFDPLYAVHRRFMEPEPPRGEFA